MDLHGPQHTIFSSATPHGEFKKGNKFKSFSLKTLMIVSFEIDLLFLIYYLCEQKYFNVSWKTPRTEHTRDNINQKPFPADLEEKTP